MHLSELEREQVHRRGLGDEGLGGGHPDLEARAREQHAVRVAGGLAADDVGDREHLGAALASQAHGGQRVGGLARLGDADDQIALREHRVAVAELGGDVHLHRSPRPGLDRVAPDQTGVVGGSAGHDHHPAHVLEELVGQSDVTEVHHPVAQPAGHGLGHGVGLLVDLLEHEGLVAALLGLLEVPVDLVHLAADLAPVGSEEARALGRDGHDLAVVDELHALGLVQERRDGRGDEALALAEPHHERAFLARSHEHAGSVGGHGDEGVVAAQVVVGEAHRLHEVALEVVGDQVGHDLGVGLGAELGALGPEPVAQLGPVLDDAVQHDLEAPGAVGMGMGVGLGHATVGGPARVPDAGGAVQVAVGGRHGRPQLLEVAHGVHAADRAVVDQRQPGGVVAAVLEPPETGQQQVAALTGAYVSDDSAHWGSFSLVRTARGPPVSGRSRAPDPAPAPRPSP